MSGQDESEGVVRQRRQQEPRPGPPDPDPPIEPGAVVDDNDRRPIEQVYRLPFIEILIMLVLAIGVKAIGIFRLSEFSNQLNAEESPLLDTWLPRNSLLEGRRYESVDNEWVSMMEKALMFVKLGAIHFGAIQISDLVGLYQYRRYVFTVVDGVLLYFAFVSYNPMLMLPIYIQMLTAYAIMRFTRSYFMIWLFVFANILFVGYGLEYLAWLGLDSSNLPMHFIHMFTWNIMRYASFGHCYLANLNGGRVAGEGEANGRTTFSHYLGYMSYYPLFVGPILVYHYFDRELYSKDNRWSFVRLRKICKLVAEIMMYFTIVNLCRAFVYVFFLAHTRPNLLSFDATGVAQLLGLDMQFKYMVIYGIPLVMTALDNGDGPDLPVFIGRVIFYREMWKRFDVGLYQFLKFHLYLPLKRSVGGLTRAGKLLEPILSSMIAFVFIWTWHGMTFALGLWSLMNWFELLLEVFADASSASEWWRRVRARCPPFLYLHLKALFALLCYSISIAAIIYFFLGRHAAYPHVASIFLCDRGCGISAVSYATNYAQVLIVFTYIYYCHNRQTFLLALVKMCK